jgi:hypothetical protein
VAPITSPALTNTTFLMTYRPSRVGAKGNRVKASSANRSSGADHLEGQEQQREADELAGDQAEPDRALQNRK